ncbi:hypothetical protein SODALDRAFT_105672 [Sodiomyces alkalinus F11]|uniref:Uncharacterized protein n=1 Tax=Sodiomyces alkalinus (strain CBS 110278 / VKM F-3762 / F11) TaxID=1314773 RepID=A0A3N2Q2D1_SODAK|nr:hypothetical protein SODALDRAFT_105672 [Sodiomyces alkalinus F11]ROT40828.1 hypothetical protein SODALDRAFT_105672 [Sodiomyces alkalinus F11]
MEDHNRLRRQNEQPMHPASNPRYVHDPSQGRRSMPAGSSDRYNRPAPVNTPPSQGRAIAGAGSYSAYNYPEQVTGSFATSMAANSMHYQSGYGQDGRQQPSFAGYNTMPMGYENLAGTTGSVYDAQAQFQRQPAGASILPTDVQASYFPNDPNSTPGPSTLSHAQPATATPTTYQSSSQLQQGFSTTNMSGVGGMAQPTPNAEVAIEEQEYPVSGGLEEKWIEYQTALRGVFQNIRAGALESASQSLLDVSNWLLSQVQELGLCQDDPKLHQDRIKLWENFNHAWLALFQAQKDMMQPGRLLQRPQSLVSEEGLERMGKELIRLCDGIERHGLVDYHYGVWEERILDIIQECLDITQSADGSGPHAHSGGSG